MPANNQTANGKFFGGLVVLTRMFDSTNRTQSPVQRNSRKTKFLCGSFVCLEGKSQQIRSADSYGGLETFVFARFLAVRKDKFWPVRKSGAVQTGIGPGPSRLRV